MGQAALDLPDPLDQQQPANPAGMDDLLAQLAGDEIDRLLAEVDAEPVPVAPPRNAALAKLNELADAPVDDAAADDAPPLADVPQVAAPAVGLTFDESAALNAEMAPLEPQPVATAAGLTTATGVPVEDDLEASLNSLFTELNQAPIAQNESATATEAAAVAPAPAPAQMPEALTGMLPPGAVEKVLADEAAGLIGAGPPGPATPAALDLETGTSAAERGALEALVDSELDAAAAAGGKSPAAADLAGLATEGGATSAGDDEADDRLPLLLRPLEWINAPMDACPEWVRDLIGKAAIITTVNAVAVLIYVMMFRK